MSTYIVVIESINICRPGRKHDVNRAQKTHPATLRWPPSLHLRWKEGFECFLTYIFLIFIVQAPLSGEAEERVAGVASPGESSTPCNLPHSLLHSPPDFETRNHDLLIISKQALTK